MSLNMEKLRSVCGSKVGSIFMGTKIRGVVTIPADGFHALVGYMDNKGTWLWIRKDFLK
jgi:hypothetical protein